MSEAKAAQPSFDAPKKNPRDEAIQKAVDACLADDLFTNTSRSISAAFDGNTDDADRSCIQSSLQKSNQPANDANIQAVWAAANRGGRSK